MADITNSQGTFTLNDPQNNPYDTFLQHLIDAYHGNYGNRKQYIDPIPNAQSRFTRAPIYFNNEPLIEGPAVTGHTDTNRGNRIVIDLMGNPSFKDVMHTLSHEDIHAALGDTWYNTPAGFDAKFNNSGRAGTPMSELPSYMGAFKLNQIPGVTAEDASKFYKEFRETLPESHKKLLDRIVNAHAASQLK